MITKYTGIEEALSKCKFCSRIASELLDNAVGIMQQMSAILLKTLRCPYCHSLFSFSKKQNQVLSCDCGEALKLGSAVFISSQDLSLKVAIDAFKKNQLLRCYWHLMTGHRAILKLFTLTVLKLIDAGVSIQWKHVLQLLSLIGGNESWYEYLQKTAVRPQTKEVLNSLQKETRKGKIILDVGAGPGLVFSIIDTTFPQRFLYLGLEKSAVSVLFASAFFAQDSALFICCDAEYDLPIVPNTVSFGFITDTFAWIRGKHSLLENMHEALKKNSTLLVSNFHSENKNTRYWGYGVNNNVIQNLERKSSFSKIKIEKTSYHDKPQKRNARDSFRIKAIK